MTFLYRKRDVMNVQYSYIEHYQFRFLTGIDRIWHSVSIKGDRESNTVFPYYLCVLYSIFREI